MTTRNVQYYMTSSGTSLTGTVGVVAGDIVIAAITGLHGMTLPVGWTLLYYAGAYVPDAGQRLYVLWKKASATETLSVVAQQGSASRMYMTLIALNGATAVELLGSRVSNTLTHVTPDKPTGAKVLWVASTDSVGSSNWATTPNDLTFLGNGVQTRLACYFDAGAGVATGRLLAAPRGASDVNVWQSIGLLLYDTNFVSAGTAVLHSDMIQRVAECAGSKIEWTEDAPAGTAVSVFAALSAGVPTEDMYALCTNGEPIPGFALGSDLTTDTLYVKIVLETTDVLVTPSVSDFLVTVDDAKGSSFLLLTLADVDRFRNVIGDATIHYDAEVGSLVGVSGPVASFDFQFTPAGLQKQDMPHEPENLAVDLDFAFTIWIPTWRYGYRTEHLSVTAACTLVVTQVGSNPL